MLSGVYFWYLLYMFIVYISVQSNYSLYFLKSVLCLSPEVLSIPLSPSITCELLGFICIFIASITVAVWPFLRSGSEPRAFNLAEFSQQQILKLFESSSCRKQYYMICYYNHETIVWTKNIEEIKSIKSSTTKSRPKERNRIWTIFVTTVNISRPRGIRLGSIGTHAVVDSPLSLSYKVQIDLLYQSVNTAIAVSYEELLTGVRKRIGCFL